jgi:hypothetical protein
MKSTLAGAGAIAVAFAFAAPAVEAQVALGYTDVGAVVGVGNLGRANIAFGGRFERVFKKLPDLGNGLLGIEVSADVYSWSSGPYSIRYIPVAGTANYHFHIDPKNKVDLFLGAGLGFLATSWYGRWLRWLRQQPVLRRSRRRSLFLHANAGGVCRPRRRRCDGQPRLDVQAEVVARCVVDAKGGRCIACTARPLLSTADRVS